jgi:hypothetical protein
MQKVSCTRALQAHCGLGLSAAKAVTDALLQHKRPSVTVESESSARQLVMALAALGVVARFAEGENYAPQERLEAALIQLEPLLPAAALATCRSLASHGEWELGLSHCIAALRGSGEELAPSSERLLAELVTEFGLYAQSLSQSGA